MSIDFRDHDSREHGLTLTQRVTEARVDLRLAQRIRDGIRAKKEAEAFAEAEKRMRGSRT